MHEGFLSPGRVTRPGISHIRGQVSMIPAHPSGLLSTAEAAKLAGVKPVTIRLWRARGWLDRQGLDERGYPLHSADAVRAAEKLVRGHGIEASGVDPRQLRGRTAALLLAP